jgi:hypothetical protein
MRGLSVVTTCCLALSACGSSDARDPVGAFTGRWAFQGTIQSMFLPVIAPSGPPLPAMVSGALDIASTQPSLVELNPAPFFAGIAAVRMRVVDDSSLVGVPFTSAPLAVTCPAEVAATCATPTAVVTLESAIGTLSDGLLAISIHGKYTRCCSTEHFVYGLAAVRQ